MMPINHINTIYDIIKNISSDVIRSIVIENIASDVIRPMAVELTDTSDQPTFTVGLISPHKVQLMTERDLHLASIESSPVWDTCRIKTAS